MATKVTPNDCATVWFAILDRAKHLRDFERAAEAQRKLRELGVHVTFDPEGTVGKGTASHA